MNILFILREDINNLLNSDIDISNSTENLLFPLMTAKQLNDQMVSNQTLHSETFEVVEQAIGGKTMRGVKSKKKIPVDLTFLYSNKCIEGMLNYDIKDEYAISCNNSHYYTVDETNANYTAFMNDPVDERKANFSIVESDDGIYLKCISTVRPNKFCYVMYGGDY